MLVWMSSYRKRHIIVTVYSKTESFCGQCKATKRALDDLGVDYVEIALENIGETRLNAFRDAGHLSAPVVEIDNGQEITEVWSGYRPDLLATLV